MVARAFQAKLLGRPVYANIPLIYRVEEQPKQTFLFGRLKPKEVKTFTFGALWSDGILTDLKQALELDNALCLLDEVHMWLPSTAWSDIPFEVRRFLAQQRKIGIDIWWTAQSNARVFNVIRELTATLWSCCRYGPVSVMEGRDPESKESMGRRYVWLGPKIWNLYDTEFIVGSADGKQAGTYGHNDKYEKLRQQKAEREAKEAQGRRYVAGVPRWIRRDLGYGVVQWIPADQAGELRQVPAMKLEDFELPEELVEVGEERFATLEALLRQPTSHKSEEEVNPPKDCGGESPFAYNGNGRLVF